MKYRLDKLVHNQGNFSSRTRAIDVIENNGVKVDGHIVTKPGKKFDDKSKIEIIKNENPWVSRGAFKLIKALEFWQIDVLNKNAIDIGASTGGFTEVLLKNGANKVYCVDVGHGQLNEKIKINSKVVNFEKTHVKDLATLEINENISLIVVDISFISLTKILPVISNFMTNNCELILLIKPQFEVGAQKLNKHGIVIDKNLFSKVIKKIKDCIEQNKLTWIEYIESPIKGGDGNIEFLCYSKKIYHN